MSRDANDDDHRYFIQLEGKENADGEEPILSRAAFQLHGFGIVHSVRDGTPGFVSDDYLNAISAETSVTATELCMAGVWRRVEDGYEVLDRDMVNNVADFDRDLEERAQFCAATGGHEPSSDAPNLCGKCWAPYGSPSWPAPRDVAD